ncbi:hypothetical protein [Flavobacterium magnum]|nr:hypothetical protein [Flavobacterium magnum]
MTKHQKHRMKGKHRQDISQWWGAVINFRPFGMAAQFGAGIRFLIVTGFTMSIFTILLPIEHKLAMAGLQRPSDGIMFISRQGICMD